MKLIKWLIFPIILIIIGFIFDFNHTSKPELEFKIVEFVYWAIVSGLLVFISFFINIKKADKFYPFLVFIIVLLYYLYWIPYGLDITDHGYALSRAWYEGEGSYISSAWQVRKGSFVIIGFWLHILNFPSVIWARFGYALVVSGIALLSYKIIVLYIKENRFFIFISIIATSIIPIVKASLTLNYNTIPVLIILLAFYILFKGILSKKSFYYLFAGILISISIFSRLTYFPYIGLPLLIFLAIYYKNRQLPNFLKNVSFTYIGVTIGFLIVGIYLLLDNSLSYYTKFLQFTFNNFLNINNSEDIKSLSVTDIGSHGFSNLITLYLNELWDVFLISLLFIITFFLIPGILKLKSLLQIVIGIAGAGLYFYYAYKINFSEWYYSIIAIALASLIVYFIFKSKYERAPLILIFFSLIFTVLSFIGTNNGIQNIIHSGGIILPLSLSLVLIRNIHFTYKKLTLKFNISYLIFVFGIIYFSYVVKSSFVYRDSKREKLTTMSTIPALWGVYSTKERIESVDNLVLAFDSLKIQDEEYQTINKNLLFPFLSDKKPVSISWNISFDNFIKYDYSFKYLIISQKNPRHKDWPKNKDLYDKRDKVEVEQFIEYANKNYSVVYENVMFKIYKQKEI